MMDTIKVIAFDADDTLWINEPYFQETERKFCELLEDYLPHHTYRFAGTFQDRNAKPCSVWLWYQRLYAQHGGNRIMGFREDTAIEIIEKIIQYGKELLEKPIEKLADVEKVLQSLSGHYRLVVATKGDKH